MKSGLSYWLDSKIEIVKAPENQTIIVVTAHPDDMESECLGTLILSKEKKSSLSLLIVTSTNKSREEEAKRAASFIGIDRVEFLRFPDGEVENSKALRKEITRWIRTLRPSILFTYDPDFPLPLYVSHPDHRATGRAALDSVFPLARDTNSFSELDLQPHIVPCVWLFGSGNASKYIDIQKSFRKKVEARLLHQSQTKDPKQIAQNFETLAKETGKRAHLPLAEAFTIVKVE